jgi:hypothetical protein
LVRRVDSSLLDEWEQLTHPDQTLADPLAVLTTPGRAPNDRATRVELRNNMFRFVNLLANRNWAGLRAVYPDVDWFDEMAEFFDEYGELGAGPAARGPALFSVSQDGDEWIARQVLDDPDGDHGWSLVARYSRPEIAEDEPELLDLRIVAG